MTGDARLALHVYREGDDREVPLLLLHGFPLDHRMWDDVVDLLPGDGAVLAVDLPGFGASPAGSEVAPDEPASIDAAADAVARTVRAAGVDRAVVAGLSLGGYVAMALVERHPDLVAGLALLDTKSTADADAARENRLRIAEQVEAEQRVDAVLGMRTSLLGESNRARRQDLVSRLESWIRDQGHDGIAWIQRAMAVRPDRTEVLTAFDGPALVVVGEEDELSPVDAAEHMAAALGRATLVRVPRAGHMTTNEAPEAVASALAQLRREVPPIG